MSKARWLIAGLLTVNGVLAAGLLLAHSPVSAAYGQAAAAPHALSGEMLVAGASGSNRSLLFVLDTGTGRMAVFQPDPLRRSTVLIAQTDVTQDMDRAIRR